MKIQLHIERLVLDGFSPQIDAQAVRRALSLELSCALGRQAPMSGDRALARIQTAALPAAASMHSTLLGVHLAQALHGALAVQAGTIGHGPLRGPMARRRNSP